MVESNLQQCSISDTLDFPVSYYLIDAQNSGSITEVHVDQMDEEFLTLNDVVRRLAPTLGPIQIYQSFISPSVNTEQTISYYKFAQPLYYLMKSMVKLNIDAIFKKMDIEAIQLASQLKGEDLFNEIQELTDINKNDFYIYLNQQDRIRRLSRNNPKLMINFRKEDVLFVKPVRRGSIQIYITPLNCSKFAVYIGEETTVAELKEIIDIEKGLPCDLTRIIFEKDSLSDDKTLVKVGVTHGSQLECLKDYRASYECQGILTFVDISKGENSKTYPITTRDAPMWRIIRPGLCIEGKCSNKQCEAYGQYVVINVGFGIVDVAIDREKNTCPSCQEIVAFDTCGFNNCIYEFIGLKFEDRKLVPVRPGPVKVGHEYRRFNLDENNKVEWATLKIVTRELTEPDEVCLICKKQVSSVGSFEFPCKHKVHIQCKSSKITKCFACAPLNEGC